MFDVIVLMFLIIGGVFVYLVIQKNKERFELPSFRGLLIIDKEKIKEKWAEVEELMRLGGESRFKTAIVEADKILMTTLELMGFQGQASEKLERAKKLFSDYSGLKRAHYLRNEVVHNMDIRVLKEDAQQAIENFKQGLKDLGVL